MTPRKPKRRKGGWIKGIAESARQERWTYSFYRATLKRDGQSFAIVTPDGRNALSKRKADELLRILNDNDP